MRHFRTIHSGRFGIALIFISLVFLFISISQTTADSRQIGTKAQHERWLNGLSFLGNGQFNQAQELISQIRAEGIHDQQVSQVHEWLSMYNKLRSERAEHKKNDYEKYVGWVIEEIEAAEKSGDKGKRLWTQAIGHCERALNYADDKDKFRQERWLLKAVEGAKEAALAYEQKSKWYEAASIYIRLEDIFPHDKEYSDKLSKCQEHIRLELIYAPDSDWADELKNITADMARDAFKKIDNVYLKEPVFKEAVIAGLKQILLVVAKPDLADLFEQLQDTFSVDEFRIRVNARLDKAEKQNEITVTALSEDYFNRLLKINRETNLLPETIIVREFAHGALKTLDRYSDMIWPVDVEEFNKHTQGRFSGVGIQIRKAAGEPIRVITPLDDTPAYRKGIQPGDLITKINGKPAKKYTITKAVREITGPAGTHVKLTIKRTGNDKEFDVRLERQEIKIETIKGFDRDESGNWMFMIDPDQKIGYIRMTNFTEGTIDELREVIDRLTQDQAMEGLIFDLRNNPGGTLKSAIEVSDLFLASHKRIVSTKDRYDQPWIKSTSSSRHYTDFPMIVLANDASASAAEIVSGALQVHNRALLVGERTFGKGSVQQLLLLNTSDTAYLKLTTALYYLPNDRCLHKKHDSPTWGVDPDIEIALVPKESVKVYELRLKKDILKGKDQEELTEESLKYLTEYETTTQPSDEDDLVDSKDTEPEEQEDQEDVPPIDRKGQNKNDWPEIDPQLETALMLMRVRLKTEYPWPKPSARMVATPLPAGE
ncbi:MAG: S41 family peptidase [Planctomycetota bacterium]|jgi:carboxyl-terminal processing protease